MIGHVPVFNALPPKSISIKLPPQVQPGAKEEDAEPDVYGLVSR